MAEQLGHLIEVAKLPNVTLQVLPFTIGEHAGMDGEFTLLRYRESADPDVVFIENTGNDLYLESSEVTRRYNKIFDHLRAAAQNPSESTPDSRQHPVATGGTQKGADRGPVSRAVAQEQPQRHQRLRRGRSRPGRSRRSRLQGPQRSCAAFNAHEWEAFLAGVRNGEFEQPKR